MPRGAVGGTEFLFRRMGQTPPGGSVPGDVIVVRTLASAASSAPSYDFEIERLGGAEPEALASLHVTLQELYPDYGI